MTLFPCFITYFNKHLSHFAVNIKRIPFGFSNCCERHCGGDSERKVLVFLIILSENF